MPAAPKYGGLKATLSPEITGDLKSYATPEAFGAGVGRAMQNFAQGVGDVGSAIAAVQEQDDHATVSQRADQYSDYLRDLTYNPEAGYVNKRGEAAVRDRTAFDENVDAKRKELSEGLTGKQRRLFDSQTSARRAMALDTSIRHAAEQRLKWYGEATAARLKTFADDAHAMADEPDKFKTNIEAGLAEIRDRGALMGKPQEVIAQLQKEFTSSVHKNVVLSRAVADPLEAKKWLDEHRDAFTQDDLSTIEKQLDAPVVDAQAKEEVARIASEVKRPAFERRIVPLTRSSGAKADVEHVTPDAREAFLNMQDGFGAQLRVRSGYRNPARNEGVGGVKNSRHMHGDAFDIDISTLTKAERVNLIEKAYDAGFTGVGVGKNTLHVDQGGVRSWGYYKNGKAGAPVPAYAAGVIARRRAGVKGTSQNFEVKPRTVPDAGVQTGGVQTGGVAAGMDMLREYESFRDTTYWDVNHHRTGYGSDTITDAKGRVRTVRKGDRVTREDAERDLARRTGILNKTLLKQHGGKWSGLDANAKGALLSVAYNYGTLPSTVAKAIETGDKNAIAAAVERLGSDNGGINAKRRAKEAAAIRTGGGKSDQDYEYQGPAYIQEQVAHIKDPRVRAAASAQLAKYYDAKDKTDRHNQRAAKLDAERYLIKNPNIDVMKLPLSIQQALGTEGMTSLMNYKDKLDQLGQIETDEETYAKLVRLQADDPHNFAENVDMFDYMDKLSTKDRRELMKMQAAAIKDKREGTEKALTEAKSVVAAMAIADRKLEAVGVKKRGKQQTANDRRREALFQRQLVTRMREWQDINKRVPSDYDVSDMVDVLLLPVVFKTPGLFWGTNDEEGFAFEAGTRGDNVSVGVNMPYENIPHDVRLLIRSELAKELGRTPTEDEVKNDYVKYVLGQ